MNNLCNHEITQINTRLPNHTQFCFSKKTKDGKRGRDYQ